MMIKNNSHPLIPFFSLFEFLNICFFFILPNDHPFRLPDFAGMTLIGKQPNLPTEVWNNLLYFYSTGKVMLSRANLLVMSLKNKIFNTKTNIENFPGGFAIVKNFRGIFIIYKAVIYTSFYCKKTIYKIICSTA